MNCRKAWSVDSKTCNSFKQPMVANQNTRNLNKKHIITAPNRLRCLLYVEALEIHGAAVTDDPLLVSSIHWLTFFVKMSRGRAPSLRMIEWKSLMSNFDPAKMKIKKKRIKQRWECNKIIKFKKKNNNSHLLFWFFVKIYKMFVLEKFRSII